MTTIPLARIHAPNDIRVDQVELPAVGADDVLVRVHRCGICGSDLSYAKIGGIPGAASPFAFGHEFAGVIEQVGASVSGYQVGERVVVNPMAGGNAIGADGIAGAFSPLVVYRNAVAGAAGLIKLPAELDFDLGALIEPLSVGMHAVNQSRIAAGDKVTVVGSGPVGIAAAVVAKYFGGDRVTVVDLSDKRLAIARQMGLQTFKADSGDLRQFLMQQHGTVTNNPMLGEQPGTDVFIEATGVGSVLQNICQIARKGARVTVVAVHFTPVEMDMINLLMRELIITASYEYPNEFPDVMEMLSSGEVDVRPMITHHFPLSDFNAAFAQAQRQNEALKVLVDCQS